MYLFLGKYINIFIDSIFEAATTISNNGLSVVIISMDLDSKLYNNKIRNEIRLYLYS
jgi:hypothetical protein